MDVGCHGESLESTMPFILTSMLFASESHRLFLSVHLVFQLFSCAAPLLSKLAKLGELHGIQAILRCRVTCERD